MDIRANLVVSFSVPDGSRLSADGQTLILPSGERLELVLGIQDHWSVVRATEKGYEKRWGVDNVEYITTDMEAIL